MKLLARKKSRFWCYLRKTAITAMVFAITFGGFNFARPLWLSTAQAALPQYLGYQGRLKDSSGTALTGTYDFTFKIYDAVSGGNLVWSETQSSITVTSGYFTVSLGASTALDIDFSVPYWITTTVNSDTEMTPRTRINAVGYAYTTSGVETRSAPSDSTDGGRLYYDSDDGNLYLLDDVASGWVDLTAAAGDADTDLGNLASTEINADLLPDEDNANDLGSVASSWSDIYADGNLVLGGNASAVDLSLSGQLWGGSGLLTIGDNASVTGEFSMSSGIAYVGTGSIDYADGTGDLYVQDELEVDGDIALPTDKSLILHNSSFNFDTNGNNDDILKLYLNDNPGVTEVFWLSDGAINPSNMADHEDYVAPTLVVVNTGGADANDYAGVVMGERTQSNVAVTHYFDFYAMTGAADGSADGTTAEVAAMFRFGDSGSATSGHTLGAGDVLFEDDIEVDGDAFFDGNASSTQLSASELWGSSNLLTINDNASVTGEFSVDSGIAYIGTGTVNQADGTGDLYVQDELEVDGNVILNGEVDLNADQKLDFNNGVNFSYDTNGTGDSFFKLVGSFGANPSGVIWLSESGIDPNNMTTHEDYLSPTLLIVNNEGADANDYAGVVMGERTQSNVAVTHYFDFYAMTGATDGSVNGTTAEIAAMFRFGDSGSATSGHSLSSGDVLFEDDIEVDGDAFFDGNASSTQLSASELWGSSNLLTISDNASGTQFSMSELWGTSNLLTIGDAASITGDLSVGSTDLYVDSSANGFVGIATTTPELGLHVNGFMLLKSFETNQAFALDTDGTAYNNLILFREDGTTYNVVGRYGGDDSGAIRVGGTATPILYMLNNDMNFNSISIGDFDFTVKGNVGPDAHDTYDLGSAEWTWDDVWYKTGHPGDTIFANDYLLTEMPDETPGLIFRNKSQNGDPLLIMQGNGNAGFGVETADYPLEMKSGAHVTAGGVWTDASDERLKHNIENSPYGLKEVLQLQPKIFNYLINDEPDVGFVAQQVREVIPELVTGDASLRTLGLKYSHLSAVLVKAIQEQQAQIEALALSSPTNITNIIQSSSPSDLNIEKLVVEDNVAFGQDMVGQAEILPGDSLVKVEFEKKYEYQPIVVLTLRGENVLTTDFKYTVVDESTSGFTVKISQPQNELVQFNWHAFGSFEGKIFVSDGTKRDIEIITIDENNNSSPPIAVEEIGSGNGNQPDIAVEEPELEVVEPPIDESLDLSENDNQSGDEEVIAEEPLVIEEVAPEPPAE